MQEDQKTTEINISLTIFEDRSATFTVTSDGHKPSKGASTYWFDLFGNVKATSSRVREALDRIINGEYDD